MEMPKDLKNMMSQLEKLVEEVTIAKSHGEVQQAQLWHALVAGLSDEAVETARQNCLSSMEASLDLVIKMGRLTRKSRNV